MTKITCEHSGIEFQTSLDLDKKSYLLGYADGAESVNRWLSVKDRLPEEEGCCLVCAECTDGAVVTIVYYTRKGRFSGIPVTHWQRLPEPAK